MRGFRAWWCFLPALCSALAGTWLGIAPHVGVPVWGAPEPLTLTEAVTLRDVGEVRRLLRTGADPNGAYRLKYGLRRDVPLTATPVEAALLERYTPMLELLLGHGATIPALTAPYAWCLLMADERYALAREIATLHGDAPREDCSLVEFSR
ncbi:MAG: hypothetical protein ABL971_03005 [Vicinamibacterales bacterium]